MMIALGREDKEVVQGIAERSVKEVTMESERVCGRLVFVTFYFGDEKLRSANSAFIFFDSLRNFEFSDEIRRLKMMSQKARSGLIQLGKAIHNFSRTLEHPNEENVFFGVSY